MLDLLLQLLAELIKAVFLDELSLRVRQRLLVLRERRRRNRMRWHRQRSARLLHKLRTRQDEKP